MRRVPYGSERPAQAAWPRPCRDCATPDGQQHLAGCCLEECAACGGQAITCFCAPALRPVRRLLRLLARP